MSLFYNTLQPILDSMSLKFSQKNSSFSYGKLRIAGALGWSTTGILLGYSIEYTNINVIFIFASVSMIITFIISFFVNTDNGKIKSEVLSIANVKIIFNNRLLIFLLISVFFISVGSTTIYYFYSIYIIYWICLFISGIM